MKKTRNNFLKNLVPGKLRKLTYKLGIYLYREEVFPSMEGSLNALSNWGFTPESAIDVGAYIGEWTVLFKEFFPECKILMIEAQESKVPMLHEIQSRYRDITFENVLLGSESGREVSFVEMETGSSVFEESSPYKRDRVSKKQITMDDLIKRQPEFSSPDFLKLDVQGYELEILKGAEKLLANTEIVLLETSLIPVNQGCPLIHEVIGYMSQRNFRMLDFCSQVRRKDASLWQTDLLFIKNGSKFIPPAKLNESNWRKVK